MLFIKISKNLKINLITFQNWHKNMLKSAEKLVENVDLNIIVNGVFKKD